MFSICPRKIFTNKALKDVDLRVYLILQSFANEDGYCFPSINKMADLCGVSRRTIERSLKRLEDNKAIARRKRIKSDGGYTSNGYYLKLEPNDDAKNESQGISQVSRIGSDTNGATNNKQCNNNNFNLYNTRASAREELSKKDVALSMEDLNDVRSCLEQIEQAKNYNFFLNKQGLMCCRPKSKYVEISSFDLIYDFFYYKCAREISLYDFNERGLNETLINFQ